MGLQATSSSSFTTRVHSCPKQQEGSSTFSVNSQDSFPLDVLARIFAELGELDLQNAASVSWDWRDTAIKATKHQEIVKILSFIDFLCLFLKLDESKNYRKQIDKLNELKDEILRLKDKINRDVTTLVEINCFNVNVRDRIVDILITVPDRRLELFRDDIFSHIPKPRFFDIILIMTSLRKAHPATRVLKEDEEKIRQELAAIRLTPLQRQQLQARVEEESQRIRISFEGYYEGFQAEEAICGTRSAEIISRLYAPSGSENEQQVIASRGERQGDNWYWYSENGMQLLPRNQQVEDESLYMAIEDAGEIAQQFYSTFYYRRPRVLVSLSDLIELGYVKTAVKIASVFPSYVGTVSAVTMRVLEKFGLGIGIANLKYFLESDDKNQGDRMLHTLIESALLPQSKFEEALCFARRITDDFQPEKSRLIVDIIKTVFGDLSDQSAEEIMEKLAFISQRVMGMVQSEKFDSLCFSLAWGLYKFAYVIYYLKRHKLRKAIEVAQTNASIVHRPLSFAKIDAYRKQVKWAVEVDEKDPKLIDSFQHLTAQLLTDFKANNENFELLLQQVLGEFLDNPLAVHNLQAFETEGEAAFPEGKPSQVEVVEPEKEKLIGQSTVREENPTTPPESHQEEKLEEAEEATKSMQEPKPEKGTRRWEKSAAADSDSDDEPSFKRRCSPPSP